MAESDGLVFEITVTTVLGNGPTHQYAVPKNAEEALSLADQISDLVSLAFAGRLPALILQYPSVAYKSSQLVSVAWDVIGPEERKRELAERAEEPLGFKPFRQTGGFSLSR